MFSVELFTNEWVVVDTQRLQLKPLSYSAAAVGGPVEARIELTGDSLTCFAALDWLRYYVVIRNGNGTPVWNGIVTGVDYQSEATRIGVTLDDMRNRILVDYTYDDASGTPQSAATDWAQDATSISRYGTKEERVSLADAPQAQAEQKRGTWLAQVKLPIASVEPGEGQVSATLNCTGLWQTLDWQYYADASGRVVFDEADDAEHLLGWGLTSNLIGFRNQAIHDISARLANLAYGGKVVVTGSAANNTTLTVGQPGSDDAVTLGPTNTISFDALDDIMDSAGGLGSFRADDMIRVEGSSANNNGYYWVKTTGTTHIEASGGANNIASAAAGPSITLTMGHKATVDEAVTAERPGNTTTITALGTKIAQSFSVPGSVNWAAYEVMVRVKKIGTPADNLRISLYSDSGSTPNAQLATATITGSTLSEDMNWVTANLGTPPTLTAGATYWIVVERTGSNAHDGCYAVGFNTDPGYGSGVMRIWNGSAWGTRWEDGDMPFQVWGQLETSTQILRILQAEGQFFAASSVADASNTYKRQYRDGTRKALAEVEELMETGTSATKRYIATVNADRQVTARQEPLPADDDPVYSAKTGTWRVAQGGPWEEGVLPAGRWVMVGDLPPLVGLTVFGLSPFFCERADYDVESGRMTPEPRGRTLPWDV